MSCGDRRSSWERLGEKEIEPVGMLVVTDGDGGVEKVKMLFGFALLLAMMMDERRRNKQHVRSGLVRDTLLDR